MFWTAAFGRRPYQWYPYCRSVDQQHGVKNTAPSRIGMAKGSPAVDTDVLTRFGDRLRAVRTRKKLSQERLAEIAGLHRTYVSLIERGERNVTLTTVEKLARALGAEMAE